MLEENSGAQALGGAWEAGKSRWLKQCERGQRSQCQGLEGHEEARGFVPGKWGWEAPLGASEQVGVYFTKLVPRRVWTVEMKEVQGHQ